MDPMAEQTGPDGTSGPGPPSRDLPFARYSYTGTWRDALVELGSNRQPPWKVRMKSWYFGKVGTVLFLFRRFGAGSFAGLMPRTPRESTRSRWARRPENSHP